MISGAWGAGKTHFWQNEIEKELAEKLKEKEKACVYVSLYGKESISEIKSTIYREAYKSIVGEDIVSKGAELITDVAIILGKGKNVEAYSKLNDKSKNDKSQEILEDGSVICLDDFERKSSKIDLNDLFGLISHLALSLKCKVIVILNSDVFVEKEAEIFRNVKEKTINKFFYYEPTIEEFFFSIAGNKKYDTLTVHKKDILNTIIETEELNARVYIQVLDNCLEWYQEVGLNENVIRVLVLSTCNFILNHLVFDYQKVILTYSHVGGKNGTLKYQMMNTYLGMIDFFDIRYIETEEDYFREIHLEQNEEQFINSLKGEVTKLNSDKRDKVSSIEQESILKWIDEKESELKALWKYGYRLYYVADVDKETYNKIAKFIKTGILL